MNLSTRSKRALESLGYGVSEADRTRLRSDLLGGRVSLRVRMCGKVSCEEILQWLKLRRTEKVSVAQALETLMAAGESALNEIESSETRRRVSEALELAMNSVALP